MDLQRILEFIKKEKDFNTICEKLQLKDYELFGVIELLKRDGNDINIYNDNGKDKIQVMNNVIMPSDTIFSHTVKQKHIRIGIVSDTHLCCIYQQLTLLNEAYKDFSNRGIKIVFHIGDIVDGDYRTRPEHLYDLFKVGATQQAEYVIDYYPKVNSIKTYTIQGSHDTTHIKNGGANIGKMISGERDDIIDLGIGKATFILNGILFELLHPGGGSNFAYSYKPQKIIDSMRGGEKPSVLIIGHFHKNLYMLYRNIHTILASSLEATTPFMTANALINDCGYAIIDLIIENNSIKSFKTEYIPFYDTIKDDYKKAKVLKI